MVYHEVRNDSSVNSLPLEFRRAVSEGDYSFIAPRKPILLPVRGGGAAMRGQRWLTMRRRKANILATARQLIAEDAYDHVAMRRLAERSEVSIPTIYNLIGSREEVLQLATSEALRAKILFAAARSELERINPILAFVDTIWMCLSHDPDYSRQVIRGVVFSDGLVRDHISEEIEVAIANWLNALGTNAGFRGTGIGTASMAQFITRQAAATIAHWTDNGFGEKELRRDLAQGTGLLLLGALPHEEAAGVTRWLKQVEQLT